MAKVDPFEFIKQIFRNSFQPVLVTDTGDQASFIIRYANPAFCQLTGYQEEELLGRSPSILQGPRSNPHTLSQIRPHLKEHGFFTGTSFNYRKDGTSYPVQWNISPFQDDEGQLLGYFSIQRDMTSYWVLTNKLKKQSASFHRLLIETAKQSQTADSAKAQLEATAQDVELDLGFDDIDLFDMTDTTATNEATEPARPPIDANTFMASAPVDRDTIESCLELIFKIENDISMMMGSSSNQNIEALSKDFIKLGDEFTYLVEFDDISSIIFQLAVHLGERTQLEMPQVAIASLHEFIEELSRWFVDIFVEKSAENIFELTPSVVASGNQFTHFFK